MRVCGSVYGASFAAPSKVPPQTRSQGLGSVTLQQTRLLFLHTKCKQDAHLVVQSNLLVSSESCVNISHLFNRPCSLNLQCRYNLWSQKQKHGLVSVRLILVCDLQQFDICSPTNLYLLQTSAVLNLLIIIYEQNMLVSSYRLQTMDGQHIFKIFMDQ